MQGVGIVSPNCERLCRGLTKQTFFLARTPREIDTLNPSPILSAEKDSISPGSDPPGVTRVRRGTLLRSGKSLDGVPNLILKPFSNGNFF